jgi:hypothetical protein
MGRLVRTSLGSSYLIAHVLHHWHAPEGEEDGGGGGFGVQWYPLVAVRFLSTYKRSELPMYTKVKGLKPQAHMMLILVERDLGNGGPGPAAAASASELHPGRVFLGLDGA